jgi:hypothetical protein
MAKVSFRLKVRVRLSSSSMAMLKAWPMVRVRFRVMVF